MDTHPVVVVPTSSTCYHGTHGTYRRRYLRSIGSVVIRFPYLHHGQRISQGSTKRCDPGGAHASYIAPPHPSFSPRSHCHPAPLLPPSAAALLALPLLAPPPSLHALRTNSTSCARSAASTLAAFAFDEEYATISPAVNFSILCSEHRLPRLFRHAGCRRGPPRSGSRRGPCRRPSLGLRPPPRARAKSSVVGRC